MNETDANTTDTEVSVNTTGSRGAPKCYAWLFDELRSANLTIADITLDLLNYHFVRRNTGGIILLSVLIAIGLIGNIHVLVIYKRNFGRSNYRIYIIWLAILDIINCTVAAPLTILYLFYPLTYPSLILCKFFRFFLYAMAIASTSSLVVIAVDMHRKVSNPLGKHFSFTHAKILCFVCVLVACALSWPAPILYGLATVPTGIPGIIGTRCFTEDVYSKTPYQGIFNLVLGGYFIVLSLLLVIMYIRIGRQIQRSQRKFGRSFKGTRVLAQSQDVASSTSRTLARRTTWTLCIVTMAYIVSAIPYHALALLIFINTSLDCRMSFIESQLFYTFVWSYFANSAINPFIYTFRDRRFLHRVKLMYTCKNFEETSNSRKYSTTTTTTNTMSSVKSTTEKGDSRERGEVFLSKEETTTEYLNTNIHKVPKTVSG